MELELGKTYVDRAGKTWTIDRLSGPRISPVQGFRWDGKTYRVRDFQRDGTYWHAGSGYEGVPDNWDLVAPA